MENINNKISDIIVNITTINNITNETSKKIHYDLQNSDYNSLHYFFCKQRISEKKNIIYNIMQKQLNANYFI